MIRYSIDGHDLFEELDSDGKWVKYEDMITIEIDSHVNVRHNHGNIDLTTCPAVLEDWVLELNGFTTQSRYVPFKGDDVILIFKDVIVKGKVWDVWPEEGTHHRCRYFTKIQLTNVTVSQK